MNSSKRIFLFAITILIFLFVFPIQSISINDPSAKLPTRHKRWTFNTWRLHGRRQLSNEFYSPKINDNHRYEILNNNNDDDIARTIDEQLSELFRKSNHQ